MSSQPSHGGFGRPNNNTYQSDLQQEQQQEQQAQPQHQEQQQHQSGHTAPAHEIPGNDGLFLDRRRSSSNAAIPETGNSNEGEITSTSSGNGWPPPFVIRVTAIAGLGGVLFGYDLGVVSTALPHLTVDLDLSKTQEEWVVSILYVGGFLGALLGGSLCDSFGRKRSILITDALFMLGAILLFLAPTYGMVLLGRIVVGFAVAVSGIADVSYLHEIAPTEWRGSIVSVNEACISLGFLLAFAAGSVLSSLGDNDAWRLMFGLSGFVALIQLVGMWDMPESPKWLKECGRHEECEQALFRIYGGNPSSSSSTIMTRTDVVPTETAPLPSSDAGATTHQTTYDSVPSSTTTQQHRSSFAEEAGNGAASISNNMTHGLVEGQHHATIPANTPPLSSLPVTGGFLSRLQHYVRQVCFLAEQVGSFLYTTAIHYRRQGWITLFLSVTQQLCGQTNVLSYAPQIFASVSNDPDAASYVRGWTTVSIGIVKFLVTVLVIWKIERTGRRPLLLSGMAAIASGLFLLILASGVPGSSVRGSKFDDGSDDDDDDDNDNNNNANNINGAGESSEDSSNNGFVFAISGIMLVVCGYSMSFGPLTWLLTSEIFPTDIRGRALGASTLLNFGSAILVTSTFLSMQEALGNTAVFAFYMFITVMGLLFALMAIPETKEKTVQQIDECLDSMLWWRRYGKNNNSNNHNNVQLHQHSGDFALHEVPNSQSSEPEHAIT